MSSSFTKIHTQLVDGGNYPAWAKQAGLPAIAPFWEYVRTQSKGTGKAEFSLEEAVRTFDRARPTIKRWLVKGKQHGFFRDYRTKNGLVTIFHNSLFKVLKTLNLKSWGATAEVKIEELKHAKILVTEIEAEQKQRASMYLEAKRAKQEGCKSKIAKPEDLLHPSDIFTGVLGVDHISERRIFVNEEFRVYGISQKHIAKSLGRSERTIGRRLSNRQRQKKGITLVQKKQLCQTRAEYKFEHQRQILCHDSNSTSSNQLFSVLNRTGQRVTYKAKCNIYSFSHKLCSCSSQKQAFKRYSKLDKTVPI